MFHGPNKALSADNPLKIIDIKRRQTVKQLVISFLISSL